MPRITEERRAGRRAAMIAAARRCFARDGYHQTSMPDIAAEAGLSPGAFYRYFPSKDDIVLEVAGQAFAMIFAPVVELVDDDHLATPADLVAAATATVAHETAVDADGHVVPVDELLPAAVQAWAEIFRNDQLREQATAGVERNLARLAEVLRRGQRAGTVRADLDPADSARVLMALVHGFVLQRAAFGLDADAFVRAARALFGGGTASPAGRGPAADPPGRAG